MHQIYRTEGVVLGRKNFGEANCVFFIYTEEFGRVDASAQGARYLKSKLRYNLGLFSLGKFSLIRSRDYWRIIDAEEIISPVNIASVSEKLALTARVAGILKRMAQGEEKNDFIWKEIKNIIVLLSENGDKFKKEDFQNLEISTILNILNNLGYVDKSRFSSRKEAVLAINKAFHESHL